MPNILVMLCSFINAAAPSAADPRELVLLVRVDKAIYEFSEDVRVVVTVENHSGADYILVQAPFDRPCVRLLNAYAPTGQKLSCSRRYGHRDVDDRTPTISISAGKTYAQAFNLSEHFYYHSGTASPHNFDQPGTYRLRAVYSVEDWERRVDGAFVGPLESEVIEFTIKPLEGARLAEILHQLKSEEPRKIAQALELLRRGRAVDAIPDVLIYLRPEQAQEVRREAAFAVMDFPDKEKWRTYAAFLKDPSKDVRVGMAYALASLKLREAGDALYEVTDPEKYPESYGSAFRALIQIDDPRVKEVAERLSQTAPSEYTRDWASRVAKGENTKWP